MARRLLNSQMVDLLSLPIQKRIENLFIIIEIDWDRRIDGLLIGDRTLNLIKKVNFVDKVNQISAEITYSYEVMSYNAALTLNSKRMLTLFPNLQGS